MLTGECSCLLTALRVSVPTYTAGYGGVPLCQGVGNRQTFDGTRPLQRITRSAFKADRSANGKVVSHTAAIPGLRDGAALGGAGLWHSFGENSEQ